MSFKKACIILSLTAIFSGATLVGCKNDSPVQVGVSEEKYNALVSKYNSEIDEYNALVKKSRASDNFLVDTNELLAKLDASAVEVRKLTRKIRDGIEAYSNGQTLKDDMKKLDRKIQDALTIVGTLEKQTSKKNMDQVVTNGDTTIKEDSREDAEIMARLAGRAVSNLSGMRDLFLSQYNDLIELVNLKLQGHSIDIEPADLNPSREGDLAPEDVSPIVDSFDDGGRIDGIARDSVSGNPVAQAFVGFKRRPESSDYFFETTTNAEGQYQSPYLLPGTYFVDINREGFIDVQNQPVRVNRGQESRENISMSEPLDEDVFRVTLSWTSEKAGAVADVDSYLKIPDMERPLNYSRKGTMYGGAFLDRDDRTWIGPETTTIHTLKTGTYIYYVNNYDTRQNLEALGNSDVRVRLYKGTQLINSFSVPQGTGLNYEIFRIEDGVVRATGTFNDNLRMN